MRGFDRNISHKIWLEPVLGLGAGVDLHVEGEGSPRSTSLHHLLVLVNLEMWLLVTLGDALFSDMSV